MTKQEAVDEITTFGGGNQQSLSGRAQVVQMKCAEESEGDIGPSVHEEE